MNDIEKTHQKAAGIIHKIPKSIPDNHSCSGRGAAAPQFNQKH